MIQDIEVGLVYEATSARALEPSNVKALADSMAEVGLINPIVVRRAIKHKGTVPFDAFEIVSGRHRYRAACSLKWLTVRCDIVDLDDLHAELAEIDENLVRANLTPAQEASAIARRKAIYEILHPDTKQHVAGGKARQGAASAEPAFAEATSSATGKSRRSIEVAAARGKVLGETASAIAGTSLDKGEELDALAKLSKTEGGKAKVQQLVERAKSGEKVSAIPEVKDAETIEREQKRALMRAWNKASEDVRQWFREEVADAPIMDRRYA